MSALHRLDQAAIGVLARLRVDMDEEQRLQELTDAEREEERQQRIADGVEFACVVCGCSDTRACDGGCVWATPGLCSRCV